MTAILAEGKTKQVIPISAVRLVVKDDITAGDGKRHDVLPGKGALSCRTICNNFELLRACGIPVGYYGQDTATSFIAPGCTMLTWEVVIRSEAHGSYLERNPRVARGKKLDHLLVELYLKTKDKKWGKYPLLCDDPLARFGTHGEVHLYDAHAEEKEGNHFLVLKPEEVYQFADEPEILRKIPSIAMRAFIALRQAWGLKGRTLVDVKFEFGLDSLGRLLLADDVDNGSWRVVDAEGNYLDKQGYRDGDPLDAVLARYREVALLTDQFREPAYQHLVFEKYQEEVKTLLTELTQDLRLENKT